MSASLPTELGRAYVARTDGGGGGGGGGRRRHVARDLPRRKSGRRRDDPCERLAAMIRTLRPRPSERESRRPDLGELESAPQRAQPRIGTIASSPTRSRDGAEAEDGCDRAGSGRTLETGRTQKHGPRAPCAGEGTNAVVGGRLADRDEAQARPNARGGANSRVPSTRQRKLELAPLRTRAAIRNSR